MNHRWFRLGKGYHEGDSILLDILYFSLAQAKEQSIYCLDLSFAPGWDSNTEEGLLSWMDLTPTR